MAFDTDSRALLLEMTRMTGFGTFDQENQERIAATMLPRVDEKFLDLAEKGDVDTLQTHMQNYPNINVNAVDYQGRTALQIAVRNQNEDMVRHLLAHPGITVQDSLLWAVMEETIPIIELLLDFQKTQQEAGQEEEPWESAEFSSHMTPLMLACHNNNYEVVRLLLMREFTVKMPQKTDFHDDTMDDESELLQFTHARIDAYRAIGSPVHIALTSNDPILTAFCLSSESRKLAERDPVFKKDYEEIAFQCREFATDLLDECRTSEEVWLLLRRAHGKETGVPVSGRYPRLTLAVRYDQKEFVTHKNTQQVLQNLWTNQHPDIMWMGFWGRLAYFMPRMTALPVVWLGIFFLPCLDVWNYWRAPMLKFMGDILSYFIFLAFLLASALTGEDETGRRVPGVNHGIDVVIWVYVASFVWEHVLIFLFTGLKTYRQHWWSVYGLAMAVCFIVAFMARILSLIISGDRGNDYEQQARIFWPAGDPELVAEAAFSVATILAFVRLLYVFQISQVLGPAQLSLASMMQDVAQIIFIFFVTLLAFTTGMYRLLGYYREMIREDPDETMEQPEAFESWGNAFATLFWAIFGFGDADLAKVVVDNMCHNNKTGACHPPNYHTVTQGTSQFLYALYHLVTVTTMLNMLIAMMSNTLTSIQENADQEWKFGRSQIWMTYFERERILPNPLNIIPSPYTVYNFVKFAVQKCCGGKQHSCWGSFDDDDLLVENVQDEETIKVKFNDLMRRLIKRYLAQLETEEENLALTPDDLEQVRLDILKEIHKLEAAQKRSMLNIGGLTKSGGLLSTLMGSKEKDKSREPATPPSRPGRSKKKAKNGDNPQVAQPETEAQAEPSDHGEQAEEEQDAAQAMWDT